MSTPTMSSYRRKTDDTIVDLLMEVTATKKYGNVFLWIRLENGCTVSIQKDRFEKEFTPTNPEPKPC